MEISDIRLLLEPPSLARAQFIETHISWVLLTEDFAYKIKRPVRFSFLDFSTLEQRHRLCLREVELNRRLTSDMYLGVVPVYQSDDQISIEEGTGEIIDYAVKMRRIPHERQMDLLLRDGKVNQHHMEQIAEQLVDFHKKAGIPPLAPDPDVMQRDFADLGNYTEAISIRYGNAGVHCLQDAIRYVNTFLHHHAPRIRERYALGFVVDGHGDLHSKNIFLLEKPVIFDCIEFNDHLRFVDVLDELAFFCIDLELNGSEDLAVYFLEQYLDRHACLITDEDQLLFRYFKLYRAGVKLKINLIKATDPADRTDRAERWEIADKYYQLFAQYLAVLQKENK